jgi:hypothetical protein
MPEHVPTVAELAAEGLAFPVAFDGKRRPTHWRLKPEGQQRIDDAMERNAAELRARAEADGERF